MKNLFLAIISLFGCNGEIFDNQLNSGFESSFSDFCATNYVGSGDIVFDAADPNRTQTLSIQLFDILDLANEAETVSVTLKVENGEFQVWAKTGSNLMDPCSDLAENLVLDHSWEAVSGRAEFSFIPNTSSSSGYNVKLELYEINLESDDADPVTIESYSFNELEMWEL